MIVHWAEEFCNQNDINNLYSHGWLESFLSRNNLAMRKATNKPVHSNETLATRAAVFYKRFTNIVIENNIQKENIYNID